MAPEEVQWGPAVAVFLIGLALGLVLVLWVRRRGSRVAASAPEAPSLELRDLDGRIEALVQQLRELEDTAAKRTPAQLARERYALELEAARALRAREALAPSAPKAKKVKKGASTPEAGAPEPAGPEAPLGPGEPKGFLAARPALRGFLWGIGTVAGLAVLGFYAWRGAQPRQEGGSLTGNTTRETAPEGGAEEAQLRDAVARNPDDLDTRLELARHLLVRRDLMAVWNETQYVLTRKPGHPRALAYQALVRLAMGQGEMALEMLKQALAAAPDLVEAHQHLVFVYASLGRMKEAEAAIAEAERRFPGEGERLKGALAQLREEGAGAPSGGSAGEDPHAGVVPPPMGETAEVPTAAEGGASVSGVIEADASVRARIAPGTAVFLTVREAGVEQGPPVAVKRLAASAFPLAFVVGPADSMMGQPLPERMRIDVRADSDGDAATRAPSDPRAHADGVRSGATGVRLDLR